MAEEHEALFDPERATEILPEDDAEAGRDELELIIDGLVDDDLNRAAAFFRGRIGAAEAAYLHACTRCGLCADSCPYFLASGEIADIPGRKLGVVASAAKARTLAGATFGSLLGVRDFDRAAVREWMDAAYGRCTLCGRCTLACPSGIHIAAVLRAARGALGTLGLTPPELQTAVRKALEQGEAQTCDEPAVAARFREIEEAWQRETADPSVRIPVDQPGKRILLVLDPRELASRSQTFLATLRLLHAAGEEWTLASQAWSSANPGYHTGSPKEGATLARLVLQAAERLGTGTILVGESAHAYAALRWEAPEWLQKPHRLEVVSLLELVADHLDSGRIRVDPSRLPDSVALHDPCQLGRLGGILEAPRRILRHLGIEPVELASTREEALCCGGGGGQVDLDRYRERRLQAGRPRAEQFRATGARILAAPCHDCRDQFEALARAGVFEGRITGLVELVAEALVV